MKSLINNNTVVRHAISFATIMCLGMNGAVASDEPSTTPNAPATAPAAKEIVSKRGFVAQIVVAALPEEGCKDTVIKKDGQEIARVPNAVPVSFSPDGRILLLADAVDSDDGRHFLMNVDAGEKPKAFGQRLQIGGRYVKSATWAKDGKSLTFHYHPNLAVKPEETIMIAPAPAEAPTPATPETPSKAN